MSCTQFLIRLSAPVTIKSLSTSPGPIYQHEREVSGKTLQRRGEGGPGFPIRRISRWASLYIMRNVRVSPAKHFSCGRKYLSAENLPQVQCQRLSPQACIIRHVSICILSQLVNGACSTESRTQALTVQSHSVPARFSSCQVAAGIIPLLLIITIRSTVNFTLSSNNPTLSNPPTSPRPQAPCNGPSRP